MRKRKISKKKEPRTVFLVICEGETEREFVEILKLWYRLPVVIKTRVSGNKINQRLVDQYIYELGLDKDDDYRVFFVYDADIKDIVHRLKCMQGTLILSNPCIELWFMLHSKKFGKVCDSASIVKELKSSDTVWTNYQKGQFSYDQSKFLMTHTNKASENASKLRWPDNPSTNMSVFIDSLESVKKY